MLHAPRQTGKTSALLALRDLLNKAGKVLCVYANFEVEQAMRENLELAMRAMLDELASWALAAGDGFLEDAWLDVLAKSGPGGVLRGALTRWALASPKPLVLMIDEIDSLVGDTLLSVLRQLRAGYDRRPEGFPQSIMDKCGSDEGHLVVFDRTGEAQGTEPGDGGKRWEDRLFRRGEIRNGRKVAVWGM